MGTYIYENGHINSIQPYYVMLNGQRYNAAHFNGRIVFGITDEVQPTPPPPEPPTTTPFYIESISAGEHTITFVPTATMSSQTIQYSTNLSTWTSVSAGTSINLQMLERMYFRCDVYNFSTNAGLFHIVITANDAMSGNVKVGGNILSLVYGANFEGQTTFKNNGAYQFAELFKNNTQISDASELSLHMTSLTGHCYQSMFNGCTSLTTAPALPATTLAEYCYANMFYNCNSLNNIECLATDLSANNSLTSWVYGVSNTGTFSKKTGVTWPSGIDGIPTGWTVVEV